MHAVRVVSTIDIQTLEKTGNSGTDPAAEGRVTDDLHSAGKSSKVGHVIVVNNGHRDFVFASRTQALKLRYLLRLYVKELVLRNFSGVPADQLLERMIELSLYTEDKL